MTWTRGTARIAFFCTILGMVAPSLAAQENPSPESLPLPVRIEYRVLATSRTSTLERELNAAADAGYRLEGVMGGSTALGGSEVVAVASRPVGDEPVARYEYKLLATSKTSTMQEELQEAADAGYVYRGQTIFETRFGGQEIVALLERERDTVSLPYEYRLFATSSTSTMQEELHEAGASGFEYVGITVAETLFGGDELVVITRRPRTEAGAPESAVSSE